MVDLPVGQAGRLLALALLIAVLAILYVVVAAPVLDIYNEREVILGNHRLLEPRLQAAAAEVPRLQARLAELREAAGTRQFAIEGTNDAIASAGMQNRIDEMAAAAGVTIASIEGLPSEPQGLYRRIGLRVEARGTYDSIVRLLGAIEKASTPLVLDNLQIHGAVQLLGASAPTQLRTGFEVYGVRNEQTPAVTKP
jgi:general secretion pathway protein M